MIQWQFEKSEGLFRFLLEAKAADGNLLIRRSDGSFEAHIIECKKTIDHDNWIKARRQLRWSLVRLLALCGVLGITLSRVVCYTAYREDRLSRGLSPDPVTNKLSIGKELDSDAAELDRQVMDQYTWLDPEIRLEGITPLLQHIRLRLDRETGEGRMSLDLASA